MSLRAFIAWFMVGFVLAGVVTFVAVPGAYRDIWRDIAAQMPSDYAASEFTGPISGGHPSLPEWSGPSVSISNYREP